MKHIKPGNNAPHDVNVVIEIPAHSDPIKYEVDEEHGILSVDRFMGTSMHYPCNYGFIPSTLADDGDPQDVLVVTPFKLIPGVVISSRPVGVLKLEDEAGEDEKILAVPSDKLTPLYRNVKQARDLPDQLCEQVEHFFAHYKDLEKNKWVKIKGWGDAEEAKEMIQSAISRYQT